MFKFRSGPGDHPIQRAVFEFLVIVTGVLVALAVDEWRQERAEIRELNQHLISLLDEVESNLESITYIRVSLTQVKIPGLETVIAHLESGETTVDDADEFLKAFADSTLLAVSWFARNRFDALKNSGSLRMLDPDIAGDISSAFEAPEILLPQVVRLQGGYPVFAQQFIPADDQSELNSLRYYLVDTTAPEFVFDISADEAIDLIHENRDELLLLARGEAAAVTANWYALKRLEIEFSALKELLESQIVAHQG
ncbi:MAG: hypothetical protein OEU49_00455 [Chromatiales bacterium]|jgi:hypothetical protein|nr:hypothetical protein [Chromatiales bacterium]MDH4029293.1 hypothetical protein [Chromatiales bacterium]